MGGIKRDAADKWFSDCVRLNAKFQCQVCGKGFPALVQGYECCHVYSRKNKSTRWCLDNAYAACSACHRLHTENPLIMHDWLLNERGEGNLDLLREKRNQIFKTTRPIRLEIAKHYREQFRALENDPDHKLVSYQ